MLFELPRFRHIDAATMAQAAGLLREHGEEAAVIAGSTDLLALLKDRVQGPELKIPQVLINIKPIPECNRIGEYEGGLRIGACATLARLTNSDLVRERVPALCQAAAQVGTTQLRNMGTLGGNLCQRPRCMYFRHPDFLCFKKGGTKCFAVAGEHRDYHAVLQAGKCVMAHPSDTAPALIALNAEAVIADAEGERTVPLRAFFAGPDSRRETLLRPDQFLKEIRVPSPGPASRQVFLKHRVRHAADFALASVAAVAVVAGGICREITLVLGGVAPLPVVARGAAELLKGRRLEESLIAQAAEAALAGARPLHGNRYKIELAKNLVRRALVLIAGRA